MHDMWCHFCYLGEIRGHLLYSFSCLGDAHSWVSHFYALKNQLRHVAFTGFERWSDSVFVIAQFANVDAYPVCHFKALGKTYTVHASNLPRLQSLD